MSKIIKATDFFENRRKQVEQCFNQIYKSQETDIEKSDENDLEKGGVGSGRKESILAKKPHLITHSNFAHSYKEDEKVTHFYHKDGSTLNTTHNDDDDLDDKKYLADLNSKKVEKSEELELGFQFDEPTAEEMLKADQEFMIKKALSADFMKSYETDIEKSFTDLFTPISTDIIQKANLDKTGLVAEKVKITHKDGTQGFAIRWVNKDTNEPGDFTHMKKFKKIADIPGATIEEKLHNVSTSNDASSQKTRDLISLGVFDRDTIKRHNGGDEAYARQFLRASDIDVKDFIGYKVDAEGNITEPEGLSLNPADGEGLKGFEPAIDTALAIDDARDILSKKDFDKFKKEKISGLKEKFGVSADTMWLSYERSVRQLLDTGQPKSIIAFGTGGVGKTWTLEQILSDYVEKEGLRINEPELDLTPDEYDVLTITGSTGKKDLWGMLFQHKDDKLIIFDDCDTMWRDDDQINWFKGMLDSSGNGTVRYGQGDTVRLEGTADEDGEQLRAPRSFRFTSKVIFVSNMNRDQFVSAGAGPLFESRCKAIDLTMSKEQTLQKLNKIKNTITIKDNKGTQIAGITQEDRDLSMDLINELADFVEVSKLNGRTLGNLIGTATYYRKKNFSREEFVQEAVGLLTA